MSVTSKTLVKSGNCTDAYIPGQQLIMKWQRIWNIVSVMYSPATDKTYIRLKK